MKKKLGTALDEDVITELKVLAAKEDKKLSWLIEDALRQYLKRKQGRVVRKTKGTLRASPQVVQAVLEEEEFYAKKSSMPPEEKALPLLELPAGQTVFIDANIFIYHFTGLSQECSSFLERCERGELWGVTAVHIILEVLHRLMMIEAVTKEAGYTGERSEEASEEAQCGEAARRLSDPDRGDPGNGHRSGTSDVRFSESQSSLSTTGRSFGQRLPDSGCDGGGRNRGYRHCRL